MTYPAHSKKMFAFAILGLMVFQPSFADTVVLPARQDAQINAFSPNFNYGSFMDMAVYNNRDNEQYRSLIEFDLDSLLPENAVLTHAVLELNISGGYNLEELSHKDFRIYRLTQKWDENAVNWVQATETKVWSSAGGAFEPCSECSISGIEAAFLAKTGIVRIDITSLVEDWSNQIDNHGLIITLPLRNDIDHIGATDDDSLDHTAYTGAIFSSRESANGPRLIVSYERY